MYWSNCLSITYSLSANYALMVFQVLGNLSPHGESSLMYIWDRQYTYLMSISDKCSEGKEKQDKEILAVWCLNGWIRENSLKCYLDSEVREQAVRIPVGDGVLGRGNKYKSFARWVCLHRNRERGSRAVGKGMKETAVGNEAAKVARSQLVRASKTKVRILGFKCQLLL